MDQKIIDLYDDFTHRHLDRRLFMERLSAAVGSTAAALALVPLLQNNAAQAAMVAPDDRRLEADKTTFAGETGVVSAYLARPAGAGKTAGVIVIHENRGLNAHIEDVARRVALAGYTALAPDLLAPLGGTPADEDKAREMIGRLDAKQTVGNLVKAVAYLKGRADATGKVGCIGFCWGGGMTNQLAVAEPALNAAAPYYGRQPAAGDVAKIRAPLLLHYAGTDANINPGIPAYEAALKAAGKKYTIHMYEGAQHAFNNDTAAARYNKAAADLAWGRTLAFLKANLA